MHKLSLAIIFTLISLISYAQQQPTLQQKLRSELSLQAQFQTLLNQSRSQDADFKVIRKSNVEIIQRNVSDSVAQYRKEIAELKNSSSTSTQQIQALKDSVEVLSADLTDERSKTNSISFLGMDFAKSTYHTMVWSIIIVLGLAFFVTLISFRKAKVDAVDHQKTAEEAQTDFLAFKKKAMETEQKLKRQLLDEQMKRES